MTDEFSFLAQRKDLVQEPPIDEIRQELEMLRVFYEAWEALHRIPHDPRNRTLQENAAQALVDAANTVRRVRQPRIQRINHGN